MRHGEKAEITKNSAFFKCLLRLRRPDGGCQGYPVNSHFQN
jgi:hypothetical protein